MRTREKMQILKNIYSLLIFIFPVFFMFSSITSQGAENKSNIKSENLTLLLHSAENSISSDPLLSFNYAEKAYKTALNRKLKKTMIDALIIKIKALTELSRYSEAMNSINEAIELSENLNSKLYLAQAMSLKGILFLKLDNFKESSELFYKSLKLFYSQKDSAGIANQYFNIANLYFKQNRYNDAQNYYLKAKHFHTNNSEDLCKLDLALATIYIAYKKFKNAIAKINEILRYDKYCKTIIFKAECYMQLGNVYNEMNDYKNAANYFIKAHQIFDTGSNKLLLTQSLINLSAIKTKLDDNDSALKYALMAKKISDSLGLISFQYQSLSIIREINKNKGDYKNALLYSKLLKSAYDSLSTKSNNSQLDKLFFIEEENIIKHKSKIRNQSINFIISSFAILLSLILIWIIYYRFKQKKLESALQLEYKTKNEDLLRIHSQNTIFQNQINENKKKFESAISDLENIKSLPEINLADSTILNKIIKELKKLKEDDSNKELEIRLKQNPENFDKKLSNNFPNLTPNELKLCSHIRSGKSNREISELTGQSLDAVDVARYRLRKKLGINSKKIDLFVFLQEY